MTFMLREKQALWERRALGITAARGESLGTKDVPESKVCTLKNILNDLLLE